MTEAKQTCPYCRREIALNEYGRIVTHYAVGHEHRNPCPGTGTFAPKAKEAGQ